MRATVSSFLSVVGILALARVSPIHAALAPDTKLTPPAPLAGEPLNYGEILYLSSIFYEAQRSGALPSTNRVPWRGDSALTDGADKKVDLSGGWYDAGDHLKFAFTMAFTATTLAWSLLEFPDAYDSVNERSVMMDTIKWGLDWLLKAHHKPDALIYQVASFDDHSYWGPPESFPSTMKRPSFELNPQHPGSDIAGEVAAAFAAASLVFAESDSVYSKTLLLHARQLFDFADTHRGIGSKDFYGSTDYTDELAWAATWLFKATGEADYLQKAELMFDACCGGRAGTTKTDYDWGDKGAGVQLLLFHITNSQKYKVGITEYLQTWLKRPKTPKGLTFYSPWGSNRYTANTAFIALMAASYGLGPQGLYVGWAQKEIDYILTAGGKVNQKSGRPEYSYVIGFGEDFPRAPHHRSSSCDGSLCECSTKPHPHTLYGALVGGPGEKDDFVDDCSDYQKNEGKARGRKKNGCRTAGRRRLKGKRDGGAKGAAVRSVYLYEVLR